MLLFVLIEITNFDKTFSIVYYFIFSESIETFAFMWACLKKLFFYNNYLDSVIILNDFSLNFNTIMK